MTVQIRYFASVRERVGRAEQVLHVPDIKTVREIWDLAVGTEPPSRLLVAINQEYGSWEAAVRDGDEVAFFPPVTGG